MKGGALLKYWTHKIHRNKKNKPSHAKPFIHHPCHFVFITPYEADAVLVSILEKRHHGTER